MDWVSLALAGILGAAVAGVAGFGSATVLIPLVALFTDLPAAIATVAVYHGAANVSRLLYSFRAVDWRVARIFGIPSLLLAAAGAVLLGRLELPLLRRLFGGLLASVALLGFINVRAHWRASTASLVTGGALSGFLAGLIGMGGAVRSLFLVSYDLEKTAYIATGALIAIIVDVSRTLAYTKQGIFGPESVTMLSALVPAAFLGSWLGRRVLARLPQPVFRKAVFLLLLVAGVHFAFM
jgi:uncharacterized membrane protein YfcA